MHCRSCRARLGPRDTTCPSCGRRSGGVPDLGSASASTAGSAGSHALPPAKGLRDAGDSPEEDGREALSLTEMVDGPRRSQRSSGSGSSSRSDRPAGVERRQGDRRQADRSAAAATTLGRDEVFAILIEQPDLIEKGLRLHADGDGGAAGAHYTTPVGDIDLLARDSAGGWVLVLLAEAGQEKALMSDLLQLMGWVRKHLCSRGQEVRSIVLVESAPDDLGYAAAALADTVEFKRYRLALSFENVDL